MNANAALLVSKADDNLLRHFQAESTEGIFQSQAYQEWNLPKPPQESFRHLDTIPYISGNGIDTFTESELHDPLLTSPPLSQSYANPLSTSSKMQLRYLFALLLASTSCTLATPINGTPFPLSITGNFLTGTGNSLSPQSTHAERGLPGSVGTCVKIWLKNHNDAGLDDCIKAALHDQGFAF